MHGPKKTSRHHQHAIIFSAPLFFPGIVAGVDDQVFLPVHIPDADDRSFFFTPGEFKMQGVAADIVSAALVL